jgi:hypothetical protein
MKVENLREVQEEVITGNECVKQGDVTGKVMEDIILEEETDELEVILKYCDEIAGKVMDIIDLAAEANYERDWSDELQIGLKYCGEVDGKGRHLLE